MKKIRLALAQINPTVGDLKGNTKKIIQYIAQAQDYGADVVAFPELAITGYPPEDLLLKPVFIDENLGALKEIAKKTSGITAIVGFIDRGNDIFNSAAVLSEKKIVDVYHKVYLPNYGPFDEQRYFQAGSRYPVYRVGKTMVGVSICEDIWYPEGPPTVQSLAGAELIININASPYTTGKAARRERMLSTRAIDSVSVVAYLNMVGGQDELVFDGNSLIVDEHGETLVQGKVFEEDLIVADLDMEAVFMRRLHDPRRRQQALGQRDAHVQVIDVPRGKGPVKARRKNPPKPTKAWMSRPEKVYSALKMGLADYVGKNGFKDGVLIGLSGGVDSSMVAAIAVDALGRRNVRGIFMPSRYTSRQSRQDAYALAKNLGIKITEVPIDDVFQSFLDVLKTPFKGCKPDVTEENLQARVRGTILMAHSNKFGCLVLTTGNKSEVSVGYATLYGDMAGGFAVISDVPKTMLYELARWRNEQGLKPVIPERVIEKPPSAELAPGQFDTDSLPPYEVLDPVLKAYVEDERTFEEIISLSLGCNRKCVQDVIRMIDRSEYKRRQAPPGIKITPRAFGKDRRFPITNRFKSY